MKGLRYYISLLLWAVSLTLTAQTTPNNPPLFMVGYNNDSVSSTISQSGIGFARSSDGTNYSLSTDGKYNSLFDLSKIKYINRYYEPALLLSASEIDFGIVEIGETKSYPLSVTNKGVFLEYIHVASRGNFSVAPENQHFLLEPGQSLTIDITYTPTSEMTSTGSLELKSSSMIGKGKNVILSGIGTEFDPQAHIFPEVIPNSADNSETILCDTLNGKYTVSYEGEVPDVKEGNVVFVNSDSTTHIILVTSVKKDGKVVSFEGKRGDLSYVFHDVSFTLSTAANDVIITRLNGKETLRRVSLRGPRKVKETICLFDKKNDFDIPIFKKGGAKISLEGSFQPSLNCELYFEFYEPIHDVFEGVTFTKAGLFRSGVKFIGELKTTCNLIMNVKKVKERWEDYIEEPILRKKNLFPQKHWEFVVFGVPVMVTFGCDLYEQARVYFEGEFEFNYGFVSTIRGLYGFSYDPNDHFNGYVPVKDVITQFESSDAYVKGKLEAGLKAYLIPRFYARLYDLVGPCVELKPYFDFNLGGAFQEEFIDTSEGESDPNYISTYINASFGVDWGLGFSVLDEIEFGKFADHTWDMGKTFIDPFFLFKSPADLKLISESTKKIRKGYGIDLTFDAQCQFLKGTYTSPFFPVIKIDIPKRNFHTYLFTAVDGKANYKWIPQSDDEELYAKVYDKDGNAVKTICLPNPDDNSMRAITDEATNVTANSAVLNGVFDSGNTVVIDKMGFVYSSVEQVPKISEENCTFVEMNFDEVMEKSYLLKGLNPGTTYYCCAYASNRYGSNYGNVVSFTTEGQPPINQSTIYVNTKNIDFGTVAEGETKTEYFSVVNSGDYDLKFTVEQASAPFIIPEAGTEFTLAAGDTKVFTVTCTGSKTENGAKSQFIHITSDASNSSENFGINLIAKGSGDVYITDGLVAYYPFNGNANDESGNGNNGTPTENVTLTTGLHGDADGAYLFGGIDKKGHIHIPNSESLKFNEEATMSFYVKPTSWVGEDGYGRRSEKGSQCFFAKPNGSGLTFHLLGDSESFEVYSSGDRSSFTNGNAVVKGDYLNKWTHIAFVYTANNVNIYIDGQLITSLEGRCNFSSTNNYDMYFGKNNDSWHPFCGAMDEIRLYNRALSSEEVKELAQYASAPKEPEGEVDITDGLVAYYPFNGNANDESGNGNNGTVIGHVELAPDRFGNADRAYRFFGEPMNYISVPDNESLHCSIFTLNAWVYTDAEDYGRGYLINKGRDINNGSYYLNVRSVRAQNLYSGINEVGIEENPETNVWHMITGTVEGDIAKFYVDGVLMTEQKLSNPFVYGNTDPLTLGMHYYTGVPSGWAYPFRGVLDDVRIYNRVLTQSEISALYTE